MEEFHIWPEETSEHDGFTRVGFVLEHSRGDRCNVWYRLPTEFSAAITSSCDPFVLAALFKAMGTPANLVVHGEVSSSLLCNLEEFQAAWKSWKPKLYTRVEIKADIERERSKPDIPNAVMVFSGGVDSCFTAWRYRKDNGRRLPYSLQAGLFIHGIEIPLKNESSFDDASSKARAVLNSLGMALIPLATNQRILHRPMIDSQAAFMASCLMLLQDYYLAGIIAGSHNYRNLAFPYGTNPITDPMLSNQNFSIIYDGAKFSRLEKIAQIAGWPEGLQNLRVCMGRKAGERNNNCCRCEKCIRTILEFRVLGLGLPPCFERDVSNRQILKMKYRDIDEIEFYDEILAVAKKRRISDSWIKSLYYSKARNRLRLKVEQNTLYNFVHRGLSKTKRMIRKRSDST